MVMKTKLKSPTKVKIGQFYDVPTVKTYFGEIFPILLPAHVDGKDNCIEDVSMHYHIDFRFHEVGKISVVLNKFCFSPFLHKFKAISNHTNSVLKGQHLFFFVNRWYYRKRNTKLKANLCPHQGLPVVNKCGTCPGHGLVWNLKTLDLSDFQLPFYLELANSGKHLPDNPRGAIINDKCEICLEKDFLSDGSVTMTDALGRIYNKNWVQKIAAGMYYAGSKITFTTDKICD